jgi:hypothetical protein
LGQATIFEKNLPLMRGTAWNAHSFLIAVDGRFVPYSGIWGRRRETVPLKTCFRGAIPARMAGIYQHMEGYYDY